mmetsp:Transcript_28631/g.68257  ORF Transcript_28631/g.68257 Transcript_28631/m.68257 type:complete len:254 (-) Transcript_28631:169-930(-)
MTSEGGAEVLETSPVADFEASLKKLRSRPIASSVDGLRKEIASLKETFPVEEYDTFWGPRGPYTVQVMLNFSGTKRSAVYKALEMLAVRKEALALMLEKKRVADAVAKHASEHGLEEFDCPICLDTVIRITDDSILHFSCCGNGLCATCAEEMEAKGKFTSTSSCPLCRASMSTPDESVHLIERIASRGIAWGQFARSKDLLFEKGYDKPISNNPNEEEGLSISRQIKGKLRLFVCCSRFTKMATLARNSQKR